jgi:hypothetical protein
MIIYLDQSYWTRLASGAHPVLLTQLERLVTVGRAICPVSAVHVIETIKRPLHGRTPVFDLMARLSGGWCLTNPVSAMRLEWERYRYNFDRKWIKDRLLTKNPIEMLGPTNVGIVGAIAGAVGRHVGLATFVEIVNRLGGTKEATTRLNAVFERGARDLNAINGEIRCDRIELRNLLGRSADSLPSSQDDIQQAFPSLRVRATLRRAVIAARELGATANDIPDLGFISETIPYLDIVTVDRSMGSRIAEASTTWPFSFKVVSDIERLGEALSVSAAG